MRKLIFMVVAILMTTTGLLAQTKAGKVDTTKHTTLYSCPKHPEITAHEPGKCSKCGMELNLSGKEQMKSAQVKNYTCPVHLDVTTHNPGKCPKCGKKLNLSPKEQMKAEVTKMYTCPMHPDVSLDKEGNCPKCGKALVEKKKNK
ncbi:MAG: heavy metal-binding domain-containing protein [Flavitalea sp.]